MRYNKRYYNEKYITDVAHHMIKRTRVWENLIIIPGVVLTEDELKRLSIAPSFCYIYNLYAITTIDDMLNLWDRYRMLYFERNNDRKTQI